MREHLFRAKRLRDGEWVEGSLCCAEKLDKTGTEYFIIEYSADGGSYLVDPNTVGQYTGLKDKNGKRIFEGDVITRQWLGDDLCYVVGYDREICGFIGNAVQANRFTSFYGDGDCFEIVGNIHDNPALMDQEGDKNAG